MCYVQFILSFLEKGGKRTKVVKVERGGVGGGGKRKREEKRDIQRERERERVYTKFVFP